MSRFGSGESKVQERESLLGFLCPSFLISNCCGLCLLIFAIVLVVLGSMNSEGERGFHEGLGLAIFFSISFLFACCTECKRWKDEGDAITLA